MRKNSLLVLTAGYWQQPVIRCAKDLGLHVIATDASVNAPAAELADEFICVDSLDVEALARIATEHGVSGIVAEQTDLAVVTAAAVAERCNLPGIGVEVALRATNKKLMRDACAKAGVPIPRYRCVQNAEEAVSAAEEIGLPVVVKPTDSQSSKGVAKVWNISDVPLWFAHAVKESREGKVLIEEMLIGIESSVEGYVAEDKITVLGICEKIKSPPPYSFDTRLVYPATFSDATMAELRRVNEAVVRAIGIPFGITHAEYIVTPKGVFLLEVAARGCGAGVASILIPAMTGFDPIRARISAAIGESPTVPNLTCQRFGLLEFLMLPRGEILSISGLNDAREEHGVLAVDYFVKAGDRIVDIQHGAQRPGFCLIVGDSYQDLKRTFAKVNQLINVRMFKNQ
jgi:biotin carboxylase